jgi:hypothetical protein
VNPFLVILAFMPTALQRMRDALSSDDSLDGPALSHADAAVVAKAAEETIENTLARMFVQLGPPPEATECAGGRGGTRGLLIAWWSWYSLRRVRRSHVGDRADARSLSHWWQLGVSQVHTTRHRGIWPTSASGSSKGSGDGLNSARRTSLLPGSCHHHSASDVELFLQREGGRSNRNPHKEVASVVSRHRHSNCARSGADGGCYRCCSW